MNKFAEQKIEIIYLGGKPAYANIMYDLLSGKDINFLYGPTNLKWEKKLSEKELESLSNSSLKEILKGDNFLNENGYKVVYEEALPEGLYTNWLRLYRSNIEQKEFGNIYIDETSFKDKIDRGGIFILDPNNSVIGGVILTIKKDYISCDYRAHEYTKIKNTSLAALLELYIERFARQLGKKTIKRGTDPNIYGPRVGTGLHDFKVRYGFKPFALDGTYTYYPRGLVLFQEFEKVITYQYTQGASSELSLLELDKEDCSKYLYDIRTFLTKLHS